MQKNCDFKRNHITLQNQTALPSDLSALQIIRQWPFMVAKFSGKMSDDLNWVRVASLQGRHMAKNVILPVGENAGRWLSVRLPEVGFLGRGIDCRAGWMKALGHHACRVLVPVSEPSSDVLSAQ